MSEPNVISDAAQRLLRLKTVGLLGTRAANGDIALTPVSPMFDGTHLRFSTTTERAKYRNLQRDPRASFCMLDPTDPTRYVEIRGRAVLIIDEDRSFIDSVARHHMGLERYPYDKRGAERAIITLVPMKVNSPCVPS